MGAPPPRWTTIGGLLPFLAILGVSGCAGGPVEPPLDRTAPAAVIALAGNDQGGEPNDRYDQPLQVRVVDSDGNRSAGVAIEFVVVGGGGSIVPATATTDAAGLAEAYHFAGSAGEQIVEARAGVLPPARFVNRIREGIRFWAGGRPFGVGTSGSTAMVTGLDWNALWRLEPPSEYPQGGMGVGALPSDVVVASAHDSAFVAHRGDNSLGVVSLQADAMIRTIPVPGQPSRVILSPNEAKLYVATDVGHVREIDRATETVRWVNLWNAVQGLAVTANGQRLYATTWSDGRAYEIDVPTMSLVRTFELGGYPQDVIVTPDGATLYVTNAEGWIDMITLSSNARVRRHLRAGASALSLSPDGVSIYVGIPSRGEIAILNRSSQQVGRYVYVGGTPRGIGFIPNGMAIIPDEAGFIIYLP